MIKEYRRIIFLFFMVVVLLIFWNSFRSSTYEVVTVQNVSENKITVINQSNRVRTIRISIDITKLVEENNEYTVFYDKRIFDTYRLRSIAQ